VKTELKTVYKNGISKKYNTRSSKR